MTIREVVGRALKAGCLTSQLEAELLRAIEGTFDISPEDLEALERLQQAVKSGKVVTSERKRCYNMMEELVWEVIEAEFSNLRLSGQKPPDAGDVAAYALNHLRPLYATTEEGAEFQRAKARQEHHELIVKRVRESLERSLGRPVWHPERKRLAPPIDKEGLSRFLDTLLKNVPSVQ